jgi:hypothetical protein
MRRVLLRATTLLLRSDKEEPRQRLAAATCECACPGLGFQRRALPSICQSPVLRSSLQALHGHTLACQLKPKRSTFDKRRTAMITVSFVWISQTPRERSKTAFHSRSSLCSGRPCGSRTIVRKTTRHVWNLSLRGQGVPFRESSPSLWDPRKRPWT